MRVLDAKAQAVRHMTNLFAAQYDKSSGDFKFNFDALAQIRDRLKQNAAEGKFSDILEAQLGADIYKLAIHPEIPADIQPEERAQYERGAALAMHLMVDGVDLEAVRVAAKRQALAA